MVGLFFWTGKKGKKVVEELGDDPESMKEKQLQAAIQQITKKFGKETVMWLGRDSHRHVDVISTGSLSLDIALGVGGLPKVTLL